MENKSKCCNAKTGKDKDKFFILRDFCNKCGNPCELTPPESWVEAYKHLIVARGIEISAQGIFVIRDFISQTLSTKKAKWMKEWREKIEKISEEIESVDYRDIIKLITSEQEEEK